MIFLTAALQLLFPARAATADRSSTLPANPTPAPAQRWAVEARGHHIVYSLPPSLRLGARRLAQLAADIEGARREGFEAVLACAPGPALESLRKVHFHRFVEVLPSPAAARRWAFAEGDVSTRRAA
ncbi:MAG: hypothetical protein AAGF23_20890 [Acidobacteriota bacterium]